MNSAGGLTKNASSPLNSDYEKSSVTSPAYEQ